MVRFNGSAAEWRVSQSKVLTECEIEAVLADLTPKSHRSVQALVKLVIFRTACFTGLRASSLCGLTMDDVTLDACQPSIRLRAENAKCHKANEVPIYSDATVADLRRWRDLRVSQGATGNSPFFCSQSADSLGHPFTRFGVRARFIQACKCLGAERTRRLTIHHGRHTACAMAIGKGLPVTLVRDMLSHSSLAIT